MRKFFIITLVCLCQFAFAQDKGTVTGTVTDKEMNSEPLPFANVFIKGTSIGANTDLDGKYTISVPAGNHTLVFSFVGYQTIEKAITVAADKTIIVNQEVGASGGEKLDEIQIDATVSKEKESALLLQQKKAAVIVESIGAQELSKKGVSDAATATAKVSGVAKQEGSNKVYVRGLGDRYNSTTMNGLPLPSNDPRYKNIALDLFSTDIIKNIGVSKTFSANLSGDVAGANIDVGTKEFSGKGNLTIGISGGGNSQTTGRSFKRINGSNWYGVADHTKHKVTNLSTLPFTDNFTPDNDIASPTFGLSLSGGNKFNIGEESSLSFLLVGSFNNNYRKRSGLSINFLRADGASGSSFTDAREFNYNTSKLVMGNLTYKINDNHKITYVPLFVHTNSQTIQDYLGTQPDIADSDGVFSNNILQTEDQNRLLINQLFSKHKFGESIDLNVGVSYNTINNDQPNRKKNIFVINTNDNTVKFASGAARNNGRYYHNLSEDDLNAKIDVVKYLGSRVSGDHKGKITLGYSVRNTDRSFKATYFDYDLVAPTEVDRSNVNDVLNQQGLDNNIFRIQTGFGFSTGALDPFTYDATKLINAGYANLDYNFSDDFSASVGVRYENILMDVEWRTNLTNSDRDNGGPQKLDENYILPSLNLKYNLTDNNLIRFAASQSYTFPQFKEIAPFTYEAVDSQDTGNPNLLPSTNYNFDLKWELYPTKSELISATVFAKFIEDATNRIELNAASDRFFSYLNTGDSKIYGVEVELRKDIYSFSDEDDDYTEKLKLGFNGSYMYTNQTFEKTAQFNPTNDEEQLEGAAPIILNADVTYNYKNGDKETNASLVFNYQDEKLYSIGTVNNLQSIFQKSLPRLDLIFKRQFNKRIGAKFSVKNILNPDFQRFRNVTPIPGNSFNLSQPITRSYTNGIDVSFGITYKIN